MPGGLMVPVCDTADKVAALSTPAAAGGVATSGASREPLKRSDAACDVERIAAAVAGPAPKKDETPAATSPVLAPPKKIFPKSPKKANYISVRLIGCTVPD